MSGRKKRHQSTFRLFDDDKTMVHTRQRRSALAIQRATAQQAREPVPEAVRAERLAITKRIADEIVCTQDSPVGGRYGCRMAIIRKYSHIYSWLSKSQIDWHIYEIRKKKKSSATPNDNSNVTTSLSNGSNVTENLVVNSSTDTNFDENANIPMVSSNCGKVDCWGGGGHTHFGCAPAQTDYPSGPRS